MSKWLEYRQAGIYCVPGDFYIDPRVAVPRAVISHAHSDHYPRYCHEVYATEETLAIGKHRYLSSAAKTGHARSYGETFQLGPVAVSFLPAGHILGSAQVLLEYGGQRVLYTGDISFDHNPTCQPLSPPKEQIDYMICESTFGEKELHPSPAEALQQCMEEAGRRPILIATYVLGKAQRINRLLNDLRPDLPVFVDRTIAPIHRIYQSYGMEPGKHHPYRRRDVKRFHGQYAWLLPPQKLTGFAGDRLYHKVFASGWDNTDRAAWLNGRLEVSDHASQSELQRYIFQLKPKAVRFWHGYPNSLIAACQAEGIDAAELKLITDN
jgi:putative mRNA 3-end processing factor